MAVRVSIRFVGVLAVVSLPVCGVAYGTINALWSDASRVAGFRAGIVCGRVQVGTEDAPGSVGGTINILDLPQFAVETQRIPAFDGMEFGIEIMTTRAEDTDATITLLHPPFGPDGRTDETWVDTLDLWLPMYNGFQFYLSDGDPVGIWTFVVSTSSGVIAEAQFEVFRPRDDTLHPCRDFLSS